MLAVIRFVLYTKVLCMTINVNDYVADNIQSTFSVPYNDITEKKESVSSDDQINVLIITSINAHADKISNTIM